MADHGGATELIDCDKERRRFTKLLELGSDERILTITAGSGSGKSELLKVLEQLAFKHGAVAARVDLKDAPAVPLHFVDRVVREFGLGLRFDRYGDAKERLPSSDTTSVSVHDNSFDRAVNPTFANVALQLRDWSGDPEELARLLKEVNRSTTEDQCIAAFFEDLAELCQDQTAVLLLDTHDKCPHALREWIHKSLLRHQFFDTDNRPQRLLMVLASVTPPDFVYAAPAQVERVVTAEAISHWGREEVSRAFELVGVEPEPTHLHALCTLAAGGLPPKELLGALKALRRVRVPGVPP